MAGLANDGHVIKVGNKLSTRVKHTDGLQSLLELSPGVNSKPQCSQDAPLVQPSLSQDILPATKFVLPLV